VLLNVNNRVYKRLERHKPSKFMKIREQTKYFVKVNG